MKVSPRLLANVKSAAKYLQADTPTGLTGLRTHPMPRPALIYYYTQTLNKLNQLPPNSVYRQSAEALTKQRMKIVQDVVPEGLEDYNTKLAKALEASPDSYNKYIKNGVFQYQKIEEQPSQIWDGRRTKKDALPEGSNALADAEAKNKAAVEEERIVKGDETQGKAPTVDDLPLEPPLTAEQISSIETQIGAGLIEEVIQVAEGELSLVDEMLKSKPWEDLEEAAPSGQWTYFERGDRV